MAPLKLDFSGTPLVRDAFSARPMTFGVPETKQALSALIDVVAIETGDPEARNAWQQAQCANLLKHAHDRSEFWRKRIGSNRTQAIKLSELPVLSRSDLTHQVRTEGSLLRREDGLRSKKHSTSGSSGVPAEFFISELNAQFNQVRSIAQYLMEGRDLTLNRTRVKYFKYEDAKALGFDPKKGGFTVQMSDNWLGPLGKLFKSGSNKIIQYWHADRALMLEELSKHPIGYLSINPDYVEALFADDDVSFLKNNAIELLIPVGAGVTPPLRKKFDDAHIGIRSGYSAEETGLVAAECALMPAHYHVAHSNVIVETDKTQSVEVGGVTLSPVLVTWLHSYATPVVRYDLNDLAAIAEGCPCGHVGTTLSHIVGRSKYLVKHADGRLSIFLLRPQEMHKIASFREFRVRQTGVNAITLELGGCGELTHDQRDRFVDLIRAHADYDFNVDVRAVEKIDWGQNQKRLGFVNEIL